MHSHYSHRSHRTKHSHHVIKNTDYSDYSDYRSNELFSEEELQELARACPIKSRLQKRNECRRSAVEYLNNLSVWLRNGKIKAQAAQAAEEIKTEVLHGNVR